MTEDGRSDRGAYGFLALACALTWALDMPIASAFLRGEAPSPGALAMAGLSAFGPTLAALAVGWRRKELGEVFGRWRTSPAWIFAGLLVLPVLHVPATLLEVLLGGTPAAWFYPPATAEHVAALVFFSVGEELGWRGFAHPRLSARHGPVLGPVILGVVWTAWHLVMWVTPDGRLPAPATVLLALVELVAGSVVFAWFFERSGRSLAVAIALHASAHLDNTHRAPEGELRLRILRVAVLVAAAGVAGLALRRRARAGAVAGPPAPSDGV